MEERILGVETEIKRIEELFASPTFHQEHGEKAVELNKTLEKSRSETRSAEAPRDRSAAGRCQRVQKCQQLFPLLRRESPEPLARPAGFTLMHADRRFKTVRATVMHVGGRVSYAPKRRGSPFLTDVRRDCRQKFDGGLAVITG